MGVSQHCDLVVDKDLVVKLVISAVSLQREVLPAPNCWLFDLEQSQHRENVRSTNCFCWLNA